MNKPSTLEFHYTEENPLVVLTHGFDRGVARLHATETSGRLGATYLVNPKNVFSACVVWLSYLLVTRIPPEHIADAQEEAFLKLCDVKFMAELETFLAQFSNKPNSTLSGVDISNLVAEHFSIMPEASMLVLAVRETIRREKR
jgi:hypothetical protein